MIRYGLLVQLTSFHVLVACCAWYNFMLFACSMAFPIHNAETLSRLEESTLGAIMRLAVVRLIGSVLRLHPLISASTTRNVLLMMEKIVNLPLCVFVMQLREIFSTTSTLVASTLFASCLSLFIHHVKVLHGDCLLTSYALSHLVTMVSFMRSVLWLHPFDSARYTRNVLLMMEKIRRGL